MNIVQKTFNVIPAMDDVAIKKAKRLEDEMLNLPQLELETQHIIHAGMYSRTVMLPANTLMTGALIKVPTIIIVDGHCLVYIGNDTIELLGHNVIAGSANRKQAFLSYTNTNITMIFPTKAKTVEEAEMEFTDEYEALMSRKTSEPGKILITEEK